MSDHKKTFWITGPLRFRAVMVSAYQFAAELVRAGLAVEVIVRAVRSRRSLEQNARMWAMLADVARQVQWPVNGVMTTLEPEDWKSLVTAAVKSETRMAAGLSGGFVMLGRKTSTMSVQEMTDVIEYLFAFGAERGVEWKNEEPEKRND